MAKRNLTIQLDEEVIAEAKVIAARRGMSISGLLAQQLREITQDFDRYEHAKGYALQAMVEASERVGECHVEWRREDLYDRLERHA